MREKHPQPENLLDKIDKFLTSNRKWLFVLFGITFLLKLLFILQSADSLQLMVPILDAKYYDQTAQDIAAGNIIRKDAFFMGPLYSYFLAVVYSTVGRNIMLIRIIQILGGSVTVILTYFLGQKIFRPSVSLLAVMMLILYGTVTFYEGQLLMMWLGTLINILMLYVLYHRREKEGIGRYAFAGILLGLSALARANILIFFPVVIAWILWINTCKRWTAAAAFTVATFLIILPATLHNYIASKDFVLITSNGGVNFYIGNSESATGIFYPPKDVDFVTDTTTREYIERLLGKDMKPSEVSQYWFGRAFDFMRANPAKAIKLMFRKTALFINGFEIPQIESYDLARERYGSLRILFVNFWILVSLGAVGMIYSFKRWRTYFLLYGYIISFSFSIILFFITARYRVQIAPVLCFFAAYALLEVFPRSLRSFRSAFLPFAFLASILLLTQPSIFAMEREDVLWREHIHQARRLSEAGNHEVALDAINKAIEIHPNHPESYIHRAIIYKNAGKLFQAIDSYEKALKIDPGLTGAHYDLAQSLRQLKLYELAVEEYSKAIELDPLMIEAYNNIGITYREMGRFDKAIEYFQKVVEMDPNYIKAYNNLGASLAENGRVEEAIDVLEAVIRRAPDYANAYKNLTRVYVQAQNYRKATVYMERYLSLNPEDRYARDVLAKLHALVKGDTLNQVP